MTRDEILIITNNPMVKDIDNDVEICFVEGHSKNVLYKALNMVGEGHKLLSHPLMGSIKPNQTPYKSILVGANKQEADMAGLRILQNCLNKVEAMVNEKFALDLDALWGEDLQLVDKDLISNGLISLLNER